MATSPYNGSFTIGPVGTTVTDFNTTSGTYIYNAPPRQCEFRGHIVDRWAEYLDGQCVGYCTECDERVQSNRPPGGMPFMRLKALVEELIATPGDSGLFLEINEVTDLLAAEQRALEEARALLSTARKMAGCGEE